MRREKGWLERWLDNNNRRQVALHKASPRGYYKIIVSYFLLLIVTVAAVVWLTYGLIKPVPLEIEANCNTGFVGVDYKSHFDPNNLNYKHQVLEAREDAWVDMPVSERLDIKNIDGMNCRIKIKGEVPPLVLAAWG